VVKFIKKYSTIIVNKRTNFLCSLSLDIKRFLKAHKMFESLERRRREASEVDKLQQQQQHGRDHASAQQQQPHGGVPKASEVDKLQQQHGRDLTPYQQQLQHGKDLTPYQQQQQHGRDQASAQRQQPHGEVPKELQQQQEYSGSVYEDSHIYEEITEAVKVHTLNCQNV
jgi:hypothetical protein